jgi:hypothetical protein
MTDNHIVNEGFLVYINDLLATGNIPDLCTQATPQPATLSALPTNSCPRIALTSIICLRRFQNRSDVNLTTAMCSLRGESTFAGGQGQLLQCRQGRDKAGWVAGASS